MEKRRSTLLVCFIVLYSSGELAGQEQMDHYIRQYDGKRNIYRSPFAKAAFDSSDAFDVLHYRFDLTFPLINSAFSGSVTVTCRSDESSLDEAFFHMVNLTVDSVAMQEDRLICNPAEDGIRISLNEPIALGDTFEITIAYHGAPQERGFYFYPTCAYTFAEPTDARHWFPCHDVPWDKATAELFITVPRGVEVASIGLLEGRTLSEDKTWETFHWISRDPVATYLICITMSDDYSRWSDWYVTSQGDSIELAYYIFTGDSANARKDFVNIIPAMAFFSGHFGSYPFEKYGMAEVEPVSFGGMEHQTMTTINSRWIRGDRRYETGLVHELAHMWWGDAVTLNDWPAIWLNEGFAVYSEALFREHHYGWDDFRHYMNNAKSIYVSQSQHYNYPIYDPYHLFDYGIIYKKGAWILHMLRHVVGDAHFWSILNTYYETYRYGNASIPEFQQVCEIVADMDLDWFFQEWIYNMGYPKMQFSWSTYPIASGLYEVALIMNQYQSAGPIFRMPVDVKIVGAESDIDTTVWMDSDFQSFSFLIDRPPTDIYIDPDGWVLMDLEYQDGGLKRSDILTERFRLSQNYPNPFNETTTIYYSVPDFDGMAWDIRIVVYDLLGRLVRTLYTGEEKPGSYRTTWNGKDDSGLPVPSGIYIIEFTTEGFGQRAKTVLVR